MTYGIYDPEAKVFYVLPKNDQQIMDLFNKMVNENKQAIYS